MNDAITIIDYGMGNLRSVAKALEHVGAKVMLTSSADMIRKSSKCVLPGVGAFGDAVKELKKRNLFHSLREYIVSGKPLLGICLGLQLLFEESEEAERCKGLSILKGKALRFCEPRLKIPHMGWNQIDAPRTAHHAPPMKCPLLKGIPNGSYFYFIHSYYVNPLNKQIIATTTKYETEFTSMIWSDSLFATQFHPEKSQEVGLRLLRNFVTYGYSTSD